MTANLKVFFLIFFSSVLVKEIQNLSFECTYKMLSYKIYKLGQLYTCEVNKTFETSDPKIRYINGTHLEESYNNSKVQSVRLIKGFEEIKKFPEDLHVYFPNLLAIQIWNAKVKEISSADLQHFLNLKLFEFSGSHITSIPSDLFISNKELTLIWLHLSKNLQEIGRNLLGNLYKLEKVSFSSSNCINSTAEGIENVRELNKKLHILCPDEIEKLGKTVRKLQNELEVMEKTIDDQKKTIRDLQNTDKLIQDKIDYEVSAW
jgi:hypothetical protein